MEPHAQADEHAAAVAIAAVAMPSAQSAPIAMVLATTGLARSIDSSGNHSSGDEEADDAMMAAACAQVEASMGALDAPVMEDSKENSQYVTET